jgi:hypothetical protein
MADLLGCGGTLIAPDRVLTAAHCIKPIEGLQEIRLSLGESYTSGRHLKVRRHTIDPRYQDIGPGLMARYDLGILELEKPVTNVRPLPIAERAPGAGTPAYVIGHGRRRWFGLDEDATPRRFRDTRPPVHGRAGDALRCRPRGLLRRQPLQARLLRRGRHDLLAGPAVAQERLAQRAVDVGVHGRQRRAARGGREARGRRLVERIVRRAQ